MLPVVLAGAATSCALLVYWTRATALDLIGLESSFVGPCPSAIHVNGAVAVAAFLAVGLGALLGRVKGGPLRAGGLVSALALLLTAALFVLCALEVRRAVAREPIEQYLAHLRSDLHEIPPPGVEHRRVNPTLNVTKQLLQEVRQGVYQGPPFMVSEYKEGPHGERESVIGGVRVSQSCASEGCRLDLAEDSETVRPHRSFSAASPLQRWDEALRFVRDPSGKTLFLDKPDPTRELRLTEGRFISVSFSAADIAVVTSPPSPWKWAGFGGLAVVVAIHALRRWRSARGRPLSVDQTATSEAEELRLSVLRLDAAAACVACLAAAPLIGAAMAGLLV
ncbi:MAG: hypothetical protein R3B70_41140 [Polyangiaceae bacterium]